MLRVRKFVPSKWEKEIILKLKRQHVRNLVEFEELERKVLNTGTWWSYHYSTSFSVGLKKRRRTR